MLSKVMRLGLGAVLGLVLLLVWGQGVCFGKKIDIDFTAGEAGTTEIRISGSDGENEISEGAGAGGVVSLRAVFLNSYIFIKYSLVGIGIFFLMYAGIRLVTAGSEIEEVSEKEKKNIKYIIYGLVALLFMDTVIGTFFGHGEGAGENFSDPSTDSKIKSAALKLVNELLAFTNFLLQIMIAVAVFVIIYCSIRMIVGAQNEDTVQKYKKVSLNVVLGLVIMRMAKAIISRVLFGVLGMTPSDSDLGKLVDNEAGVAELLGIINYILMFVGVMGVVTLVYAGILMVSARGNDEQVQKAKKYLTSAVIGILLALSSYTIVYTLTLQ